MSEVNIEEDEIVENIEEEQKFLEEQNDVEEQKIEEQQKPKVKKQCTSLYNKYKRKREGD
jgi:hypothetical protein